MTDKDIIEAYRKTAERAEQIKTLWDIQNLFGLTDNEPEEDERPDYKEHGTYGR